MTQTYTPRNQAQALRYQGNLIATHSYDPGMRETQRTLGNGLDITRAYRNDTPNNKRDNLLASITVATTPNGTDRPGLSMSYIYDPNKNMTAEDMGGVMDRYGTDLVQDNKDRMTSWTRDATTTSLDAQSWSLSFENDWDSTTTTDFATNTTESRTHNSVHELLSIDPDNDPNTVNALTISHDSKGNLSNDGSGRAFVHDFDNMLSSVTVAPGSSRGTPGTHSYAYDALNRRVSKTVNGTTTIFVCSGNQVLAEYTTGVASNSPLRKYVYGTYIDEPIALIDATGPSEETYYYHRNRQFSIIGLTDKNGQVVERYAYTAYGDPTILAPDGTTTRTTSDFGNTYLHTGRRFDHESGLYYYRARYYSPLLARFLQRDPLGYPDGLNTYAAYHILHGGVDPTGRRTVRRACPNGQTPYSQFVRNHNRIALREWAKIGVRNIAYDPNTRMRMPGPRDYARYDRARSENNRRRQNNTAGAGNTSGTSGPIQSTTTNPVFQQSAYEIIEDYYAQRAHCKRLHDAYHQPQNQGGCGSATTCEEVKAGIKRLERQLSLRSQYMDNFCDRFDWSNITGKPDRPLKDKLKSHADAIDNVKAALSNCWKKFAELGCCCPGEGK